MGYIKHDAIICTGNDTEILKAHVIAKGLLPDLTTEIIGPTVNHTFSFAILPDGSKEGWGESESGDDMRSKFLATIKKRKIRFDWVHIDYGGDQDEPRIISYSQ